MKTKYSSQIRQDQFVNLLLGKDGGFFVDIGAGTGGIPSNDPSFFSNTYYFEKYREWSGICIDYDEQYINNIAPLRINSKLLCEDLLTSNINDVLLNNGCPQNINYLSIDIDDATEKVLNDFDFKTFTCDVITLEHNYFQCLDGCHQNRPEEFKKEVKRFWSFSRKLLKNQGYHLLFGNVILPGFGPVEDWYVCEDLMDEFGYQKGNEMTCDQIIDALISY